MLMGVLQRMWFMSLTPDNATTPSSRRKVNLLWLGGLTAIGFATAIWGLGNVLMQTAEAVVPPSLLMLLRFLIASLVLLPFVLQSKLSSRDALFGLGVGAILGMAVFSQGAALKTVPVDQMAFISALYVVIVPLLMAVIQKKWPHPILWFAVLASLVGATLLIGPISLGLKAGTLWSLGGAVGLSLQIIGTTKMTNKMTPLALAGLQSAGAFIVLVPVTLIHSWHASSVNEMLHWSVQVWLQIGYLAVFAQAMAIWLQGWGQKWVSETEAAIAFNTEPVWTALFALVILSQVLTVVQFIGAALVVGSLTVISWRSGKKPLQGGIS